MTALIYLLLLLLIIGLTVTIYFFLKFAASILSMDAAARELGRDAPLRHLLTGGFKNAWRVLRDTRKALARNALLLNAILLLASGFALYLVAGLFMHLNGQYCVFDATKTTSDGIKIDICPKPN